ncbi:MAG TPA: flagellar hook-basal body complex protein, partial [Stellaceae bacterium]|nr:flagellar hook-basal body complex protein [Stellaceae bacterium]
MGIFGALTTAVTGMRAQAYALENISGNIANSQTTAFKRIDTSFQDLIPDERLTAQLGGTVVAHARMTNTVQGDIQSAPVATFMAINGNGFFVVQKPGSFADNRPIFDGNDLYTRRGDFQTDRDGYLVNGAGYYLMGIPIDAATGNLTGSVPQLLQFQNDFLPAQPTTQLDYRVNLASYPLTAAHDTNVPGSELLQRAYFSAYPVAGAPSAAKIVGAGATLLPDGPAAATGSADISALVSAGGTLSINGTAIAVAAGDNAAAIVAAVNAQTGTTGVTASLDDSGHLVLTGPDADTALNVDGTSTPGLLSELGLSAGTTDPTNLLTQGAVSEGQTLTIQVGTNPLLTITFGAAAGKVSTLAELNTALAGLTGGTAAVETGNGNLTISATGMTDTITVGGTASAAVFGLHTLTGLPSNGTVVGNDVSAFLDQTVSGGAVAAYDNGGQPVNVQLRWAKIDSAASGGTDTWNLFYQVDSGATGNQVAWKNVGVNYTFGANGQMDPPISSIDLDNVVVDGITLGNLQLVHGSGGVTQFADPNGNVQVNLLQQNGFPAGSLQSVAVNDKGRIVGTYSNGRTLDLAAVTLADFNGANSLKRIDGGAFEVTDESGPPVYGASGSIIGSALEGSNTDMADE